MRCEDATPTTTAWPHNAERIGEAAQTRVREMFLGPRHLGQYVALLESMLERHG